MREAVTVVVVVVGDAELEGGSTIRCGVRCGEGEGCCGGVDDGRFDDDEDGGVDGGDFLSSLAGFLELSSLLELKAQTDATRRPAAAKVLVDIFLFQKRIIRINGGFPAKYS